MLENTEQAENESDPDLFTEDQEEQPQFLISTDHEQEPNLGDSQEVNFFEFVKINKQCIENLLRCNFSNYREALVMSKSNDYLKYRGANFRIFVKMAKSFGLRDYEKDMGEIRDFIFGAYVAKLPAVKEDRDEKLKLIMDYLLNEFLEAFKYPVNWVNRKW